MKNKFILSLIIFFNVWIAQSQSNVKLMSNDSMKVFNFNGISIWGNFINSGNSSNGGSLILNEGSNVIMYGDSFKNINATQIGGGGEIIMTRPRPTPYFKNGEQFFDGGGNGSSIPDLTVNSPNNVELKGSDLKVRDSIKFINGKIILNKNDLTLGNNSNAGIIVGYDENKYIITNGNTVDTLKGYFIREQIDNNNYVFPVGFNFNDYTPAVIRNSGTIDQFKVRVFDSVYENGYGRDLNIYQQYSIDVNEKSVKRTWDIREGVKGGSDVNMTLQYNINTEGNEFNPNRNYAFISHYVGYFPNYEGDTFASWKWDNFSRNSTSAPVSPGTVTSGTSITTAAMKSRANISSFSPFTITTWAEGARVLPVNFINFNAVWQKSVPLVSWTISSDLKVSKFVIYRSIDGINFEEVGQLIPQNSSLKNFQFLDQSWKNQASVVFYKVKAIDENFVEVFTNVKSLNNHFSSALKSLVFPNPTNRFLNVILAQEAENTSFSIVDMTGKEVLSLVNSSNKQEVLDLSNLADGTYFLKINSYNNTEVVKIVLFR